LHPIVDIYDEEALIETARNISALMDDD